MKLKSLLKENFKMQIPYWIDSYGNIIEGIESHWSKNISSLKCKFIEIWYHGEIIAN